MKAILAVFGVMAVWLALMMLAAVMTLAAVFGWVLLILLVVGGTGVLIAAGVAASNRSQAVAAQHFARYVYPMHHTPHVHSGYAWHPGWGWVLVPGYAFPATSVPEPDMAAPAAPAVLRQRRRPSALATAAMRHGAPR